jgi:hypothetical protein
VIEKDNLLLRTRDMALLRFVCWLDKGHDNRYSVPGESLEGEANAHTVGSYNEFHSIIARAGVMTVSEPKLEPFPSSLVSNGESINQQRPVQLAVSCLATGSNRDPLRL